MDRGGKDSGHDHGHGRGDGAECIAFEKVLVGPVCIEVENVLSNILTS
jgi:hypothetical protein